jgi:hypothetical protein
MRRINQLLTILILLVFASAGWFLIVRTILMRQGDYRNISRTPDFRMVGALQDFEPVPTLPPLLEIDPERTDREDNGDTISLKLTSNIPEGHQFAGGEVFTVRVLASPKYRGQPNNMLHLEGIRFPIRYNNTYLKLKTLPAGSGVRLDDTDPSEDCIFYETAEPTTFTISNIGSFNSFYFYRKFPRSNPRYTDPTKGIQLQPNTCIGEIKFQVIRKEQIDPALLPSPFIDANVMIPNVAREIGLDGRGPEGTNPDGTLIGNIDLNEHYNWKISNNQVVGTFALGYHLIPPQGAVPTSNIPTSTITPTRPTGTNTPTPTTPAGNNSPTPTNPAGNATPTATPTGGVTTRNFTWTQVNSSVGTAWHEMEFVNQTIGYVGGGGVWTVNENYPAKIAKTTDGGLTWTVSNISNLMGWVQGLDCKDSSTCMISRNGLGRGIIMETRDGGATWNDVIRNDGWTAWLWGVTYTGVADTSLVGTTGYTTDPINEPDRTMNFVRAAERNVNGQPVFERVSDFDGGEFISYEFSCPSPGLCYVAAAGRAYKTADNGQTWQILGSAATGGSSGARYLGIDCTSNEKCWEVGVSWNADTANTRIIRMTSDGGANWTNNTFPNFSGRPKINAVDMVSDTRGLVGGCTNLPDNNNDQCTGPGLLMETVNGSVWTELNAPSTAELTSLHLINENTVVAADISGKIWRGVRSVSAQSSNLDTTRLVQAAGSPTPTPYYIDMPPQNAQWPLLWLDRVGEHTYTIPIDYDLQQVNDTFPDLTVVSMELYSDPSVDTCTIELQTKIKNIGQTISLPFTVMGNTQTYRVLTGLAPGAEMTLRFSDYRHGTLMDPNIVRVDSNDEVAELREDNNILQRYLFLGSITRPECQSITPPANTTPGSGTGTGTPGSATSVPLDMTKVNVKLTVKLQGVRSETFSQQYSHIKVGVAVGAEGKDTTDFIKSDFIHKGNGVYEGIVTFDPTKVPRGNTYKLLVKGPKHLAKRFCAADASGSDYFCAENTGAISLTPGLKIFDFSTVPMAPGDLPLDGQQDGVVDSSDLTYIRQNLGKKEASLLKIGDLNLDGIIDTQDFSLVINNLINNEDER